jgi:hypothetical protein
MYRKMCELKQGDCNCLLSSAISTYFRGDKWKYREILTNNCTIKELNTWNSFWYFKILTDTPGHTFRHPWTIFFFKKDINYIWFVVFLVVTQCSLVGVCQCFIGRYHFQLHTTQKMEMIDLFKTLLATNRTTRRQSRRPTWTCFCFLPWES